MHIQRLFKIRLSYYAVTLVTGESLVPDLKKTSRLIIKQQSYVKTK